MNGTATVKALALAYFVLVCAVALAAVVSSLETAGAAWVQQER